MGKGIFFNVPASGHVNPSLPLVRELVRRGETILYYLTPAYREAIEATGATFRPYDNIGDDYFESHDLDGSHPPATARHLIEQSQAMLPRLLSIIDEEQPDYILHDSMCPWGLIAGQVADVPVITAQSLLYLTPSLLFSTPGALFSAGLDSIRGVRHLIRHRTVSRQISRTYDIQAPGFLDTLIGHGDISLSFTSEIFQPAAEKLKQRGVHFVGPMIAPRGDGRGFPYERLRGRSVIYASLGTVINDNVGFFKACIAAFAGTEHMLVLSIGQQVVPAALGALPDNVIAQPAVPQLDILQKASLFISHGGMNSVHESLYYDVPLLLVPQHNEQRLVAKRVVALGAGRILDDRSPLPDAIKANADAILSEDAYKSAAVVVGDSLRRAGGITRAADIILQFTASQQRRQPVTD